MTLTEKLNRQSQLAFQRSLYQRRIEGQYLQTGESYIFLDGPNVAERRATSEDIAIVQAEYGKLSAWDFIRAEFRSPHPGWTKSGEWACTHPGCRTQIGRNLLGDQPFMLVAQHLKGHTK